MKELYQICPECGERMLQRQEDENVAWFFCRACGLTTMYVDAEGNDVHGVQED